MTGLLLAALAAACAEGAGSGSEVARAFAEDATTRLHRLFDEEWEFRLEEDPLLATSVGRHEYDDRLPAVSAADQTRRATFWRDILGRLGRIDRTELTRTDQISADIFRGQVNDAVADVEFGAWQIPLNADSGFQTAFARLPEEVPLATVADYEHYIARLLAFPTHVDAQIANMRLGMARGMTLPRAVMNGLDSTVSAHVVEDVSDSVFFAPFTSFPLTVPTAPRARLVKEGREAVMNGAVAGYRRFLDFLVHDYMPACRSTIGASDLPDGRAYYQQQIRHFTTLDLSPEEIHAIGQQEVARIRAEMDAVIEEVGFDGDFAAFLAFLRTDPRFYAKTPEELLKDAAWIAKRMDGKLPALFRTLPRLPYTVAPVPAAIAPKYTAGRYVNAPQGSTRPGTYWVNTTSLAQRPLYTLEALTLHESVPGHHLQVSLNNEIENLPPFRRFSYISAFGEGWGLYSERLGLEAGFYTDPYSNFGRLTYEMWRACRLVVDTGLHALGWSRQQAIDFLAANTALSLHEITTETDRYISWPAQALSYKLGELKIRELRARAEATLGERFDIRSFHDAVLLSGAVPLTVLEEQIEAWIAAQESPQQ
ncbi:MAG: DUF885 family protein [Acidobacteriota bacterium]